MKKVLVLLAICSTLLGYGQAFNGKGDQKVSVGANLQENASGISVSYDYGLGENISVGIVTAYALNTSGLDTTTFFSNTIVSPRFSDRFDLKVRLNANIGSVLNINDNFDVYPGLSLGLKNFGGHLGARYFFSSGFGVFVELGTTLAKYESNGLAPRQTIHNQFAGNIGAVFNL